MPNDFVQFLQSVEFVDPQITGEDDTAPSSTSIADEVAILTQTMHLDQSTGLSSQS